MAQILVCKDSLTSPWQSLQDSLSRLDDATVLHAGNAAEMDACLHGRKLDLILLLLVQEPSDELVNVISKARNVGSHRELAFVTLLASPTRAGVQKALMLGTKELLVDPVDTSLVLRVIQDSLGGSPTHVALVASRMRRIETMECRLEAFGRIGRVFLDPPGDLKLETDLKLQRHEKLVVRSQMALDLGMASPQYSVIEASQSDIYYNYANTYRLSWQATPADRKRLQKWIGKSSANFALPKTKVLWVTPVQLADRESGLDPRLFSFFAQAPTRLSLPYLRRVNPRILITEELAAGPRRMLETWLAEAEPPRLLVHATGEGLANSHYIPYDPPVGFKAGLEMLALPLASSRVVAKKLEAIYLSRKSNYSRVAIPLDGRITGLSRTCLRLEMPYDFEMGMILELQCPALEDPRGFGLYAKVLEANTADPASPASYLCELLPLSDHANQAVAGIMDALEAKDGPAFAADLGKPVKRPRKPPEHFFLSKPFLADFTVVAIVTGAMVLGLLFIYYVFPKEITDTIVPASMQEAFKGIRDAFNK